MKFLFVPVSLGLGFLGAAIGGRVFEHVWSWFDDQEPPDSKHEEAPWIKMLAAAAVQGAIFRVVRSVIDHSARRAFLNVTGTWPGQQRPDPEA